MEIKKVQVKSQNLFKKYKRKYIIKLLFPPIETMKILYSVLDKLPFLILITWVMCGIKRVFFNRKRVKRKLSSAGVVKKEEINRIKWLNGELGLRSR